MFCLQKQSESAFLLFLFFSPFSVKQTWWGWAGPGWSSAAWRSRRPGTAARPSSAPRCWASGSAASPTPHTAAPASGGGPECGCLASPSWPAHAGRAQRLRRRRRRWWGRVTTQRQHISNKSHISENSLYDLRCVKGKLQDIFQDFFSCYIMASPLLQLNKLCISSSCGLYFTFFSSFILMRGAHFYYEA